MVAGMPTNLGLHISPFLMLQDLLRLELKTGACRFGLTNAQ
jgi:hypothetical protein